MVHSVLSSRKKEQQGNQQQADAPQVQMELQGVSAGQMADLVHMQQGEQSGATSTGVSEYVPINPHQFLPSQERSAQEQGRLFTRLHALRERVKEIS
mmetsp:Transcript_5000/g.13979  ORF Transcript_5000/g.13979 Transcript_5000/m.13979 type:complete len:97 (-) Transcript_5000:2519-2809(-)